MIYKYKKEYLFAEGKISMWKEPLYFRDCVCINQEIWFAAGAYNGLYRYLLKEKKLERIAIFPHEPFGQDGLFLKICQYKKRLIFVPQYGKWLCIFHTEELRMESVKIPKLTEDVALPYFCEAVVYGDCVYMMGAGYPGILKFNFLDDSFEIIDHWFKKLRDEVHLSRKEFYLGMKGVVDGSKFFIPCYQCNRVLEFDMRTGQYCFHKVGNEKNTYVRLIKSGDAFVLVTHDHTDMACVVYWDYIDGHCREVQFNMKPYIDREIVEHEGDTWVFSWISNEICRVKESGEINQYLVPDTEETEIVFVRAVEEGLFFSDCITQHWYKINSCRKAEKIGPLMKDCIAPSELEKMLLAEEMPNQILPECFKYSLEYLIKKTIKKGSVSVDKGICVGKEIYRFCNGGNES